MNSLITSGVGRRVSAIRAQMNVSQRSLAVFAMSPKASGKNIGRIEQGEVTPRLRTLAKIALATDTDFEWLVTGRAQLVDGKPVRVPGIGERLAQTRVSRGMSQRKAAALLSASPSAKNIGRIEQNEVRAMPSTLRRLAVGLRMPMSYLVNGR